MHCFAHNVVIIDVFIDYWSTLPIWQTLPAVCRELVTVLGLQRYSRDQGSSVYLPQAVLSGEIQDTCSLW